MKDEVEIRTSNVEHRTSNVERLKSNIQHPTSNVERLNSLSSFILHPSSFILYYRSFLLQPSSFIPFLLVAAPLIFLFGPALVRGEVFVYRDAAHFYYPLFEWTSREWGAGRIPLWNPQENCGVPVLGEATSSVFYPGKLIFALPLLNFGTKYMLYIVGHVAFAAWAAYFVARRWGASAPAAAACAISYAYGGSVLFQIYNVVFLVSAAWLPLAFLTAEKMLAQRSWKQAVLFGVTLALMVLGGDPQTAYHAGLLATLYAGMLFFAERSSRERPPWRSANGQNAPSPASRNATEGVSYRSRTSRCVDLCRRSATSQPALLGIAATVGWLLAAVQILPALEWNRVSERAAFERPRSIYEASQYVYDRSHEIGNWRLSTSEVIRETTKGLTGTPEPDTHHEAIYDYSQSPWRLMEAVWPNITGQPFPENRRWISAIPAEGRSWTPSIYSGLLPLLLALGGLRFLRGAPRERWLSWMLLLSVIASLGWYGLGWLVIEIRHAWSGADPDSFFLGAPTGGLYWLLVTVLPGYTQFRYPAKWLVPAAFAMSLIAAQGWDRAFATRPARLRVALMALGIVSLCGLVAAFAIRSQWVDLFSHSPDDDYFGPLNFTRSWRDLAWALSQTALLCGILWWLLRPVCKSPARRSWVALAITAIELAVAQVGLIATVPNEILATPSSLVTEMAEQDGRDGITNYRVLRASIDDLPPPSPAHKHDNRQLENARWDRATLFPKYHLLENATRISLLESSSTMKSLDFSYFLHDVRSFHTLGLRDTEKLDLIVDTLSVKYLIHPRPPRQQEYVRVSETQDAVLWRNRRVIPRATIAHRVVRSFEGDFLSNTMMFWMTMSETPRDTAWIRTAEKLPSDEWPRDIVNQDVALTELCTFTRDDPQLIEIDAALEQPGLLVLGDLYYSGWVAQAKNEETGEVTPLKIMRTNRIMRGVFLPAGKHRVTFSYRPLSFYFGAAISAAAWLGLGIVLGWRRRRVHHESHE